MPGRKLTDKEIAKLNTCTPDLVTFITEISKEIAFRVKEGHRGEKEQNAAYERGTSKLKFPNSKHNSIPSKAVDIEPIPIHSDPKKSMYQFYFMIGYLTATAKYMYESGKITKQLRFGTDWNKNLDVTDEKFTDLFHIEEG